jgi:toxin HigB-1
MICSFKSKDTEELFHLQQNKRWKSIERQALRKLVQLDIATALEDMKIPPGNRLEALHGDRRGQWSIRINDQFRICFRWTELGPEDVQIVDYH